MKRLAPLLTVLFVAGLALAPAAEAAKPCQSVEELDLYDPDRPEVRFTTPPYVAIDASGGLRRLASRSRPSRR